MKRNRWLIPSLRKITCRNLLNEGRIEFHLTRILLRRIGFLELRLGEHSQEIPGLCTSFDDLLHEPLNDREYIDRVQTTNLVREELEGAFHLHQSLLDIFTQFTIVE